MGSLNYPWVYEWFLRQWIISLYLTAYHRGSSLLWLRAGVQMLSHNVLGTTSTVLHTEEFFGEIFFGRRLSLKTEALFSFFFCLSLNFSFNIINLYLSFEHHVKIVQSIAVCYRLILYFFWLSYYISQSKIKQPPRHLCFQIFISSLPFLFEPTKLFSSRCLLYQLQKPMCVFGLAVGVVTTVAITRPLEWQHKL